MKEIYFAIEIYLMAFVISLAVAFLIQGMLAFTRLITRKKEEITHVVKESEVEQ